SHGGGRARGPNDVGAVIDGDKVGDALDQGSDAVHLTQRVGEAIHVFYFPSTEKWETTWQAVSQRLLHKLPTAALPASGSRVDGHTILSACVQAPQRVL